ncbi:hypothetical protein BDY21DRAFT_384088 [Lineolata rhizophorae]|uniref:Uncharacterized protein n=1 Tax=Lineolata rhizophorae TaxID=578093 RepID=A0A6A6P950_9PEZI|nr:hypothetical protein BDY21DRAFT_384088 [Lineolata rhizophorae]
MLSLRSLAGRTALLGVLGRAAMAQQCLSFGMDFQNGGSYFQNSLSDDPFTFVSQFDHCQDDVATNILVDPNGDEYVCTDTPLQPDDTDQMSECPLAKNELWSGDWSVIILSNNGNGDPIAYERDFHLDVGPQATTTVSSNLNNRLSLC